MRNTNSKGIPQLELQSKPGWIEFEIEIHAQTRKLAKSEHCRSHQAETPLARAEIPALLYMKQDLRFDLS